MKFLDNLSPFAAGLISVAVILFVGIIVKQDLIDSAFADRALTFLGGTGVGLVIKGGATPKPGDGS